MVSEDDEPRSSKFDKSSFRKRIVDKINMLEVEDVYEKNQVEMDQRALK